MWLEITLALSAAVGWILWRRECVSSAERSQLYEDLVRTVQADKAAALAQAALDHAVFNSMVEGALLLDSDDRILAANAALSRLFDLDGNPKGRTILEAIRHHQLVEIVESARRTGKIEGYELQLPRMRGRILRVNAAAVFDARHRRAGTVLVFHDVTRLTELENVRRDFVANVSHELRTPVTLIKSAIETLLAGAKDDPAASARFLETISRQSDRLGFLIDDLLVISELESGRSRLNLQIAPIKPIADDVIDQLDEQARAKQITITNKIDPQLSGRFDRTRIEQVLLNLTDNAVKYTDSGGAVELGSEQSADGFLKIFVSDNGPGIPDDARERVFERFYRVDRSRSRASGGTGLGLSIVKHIVQAHGGKIWVESKLRQGTTFYFTLPQT